MSTSAAEEHPAHVYKILPEAPPSPLPGALALSPLDREDGFVHLSTAEQVPKTADLFFTAATSLWVARIPVAALAAMQRQQQEEGEEGEEQQQQPLLRWEGGGFPHLYANFGAAEIESVRRFDRPGDAGGDGWAGVFAGESARGWLVW